MDVAAGHQPSTAVVLAGGGALGAYEAGALRYVLEELTDGLGGRQPRFDLFAGTSVGGLNAAILASRASLDPRRASHELVEYWRSLSFDQVLRFSRRELVALFRLMLGQGTDSLLRHQLRPATAPHPPVAGLFDTSRLLASVRGMISRPGLRQAFADGSLRGLALCATEVCTGKGVIFYQTAEGVEYRAGRDPVRVPLRVDIGVQHAMASAALPFLFPSVQIDGVCYIDGALRQNTPLNPVLRMGAERVLVVSITQEPSVAASAARVGCRRNPYPGALFLLGKAVNVLLAQSVDHELNRLEMVNRLIADGIELYGVDYLKNLNRLLSEQRNAPYRLVRTVHLRPSRDLHRLAVQTLRDAPDELDLPGPGGRLLTHVLRSEAIAESDLLSYVLFTPTFVARLLELGYEDARRQHKELVRFFADDAVHEQLAS
jgi:NTE family protein